MTDASSWDLRLPKKVSDHKECRPDLPDGCPRCAYTTSDICCEICSPEAFMLLTPVSTPARQKQASGLGRSRINKDYERDQQDRQLASALHEFRQRKTLERFGAGGLRQMGAGLIMTDDVLARIVDCAHFNKIRNQDTLAKETRWIWVNTYAIDVLEIIQGFPARLTQQQLTTTTPLQPRQKPAPAASSPVVEKVRRRNKCSACNSEGHIG